LSEIGESNTIPLARIAELLQDLFPSVQVSKETTREYYSKTTALWLHDAKLAFYDRQNKNLQRVDDEAIFESVVERRSSSLRGFRFPVCFRNAVIECLELISTLGGEASLDQLMTGLSKSYQSIEKALSDNFSLGFVSLDEKTGMYCLTSVGVEFIKGSNDVRRQLFRQQSSSFQVFNQFVLYVEAAGKNGISSKHAASTLVEERQLELADATIDKLGAILANWAEYAEIIVRLGRL
jgi:hypothetical protein